MQPIFPRALEAGDTIALVAPAGVLDRTRVERAIGRLEERGFCVKTYRDIFSTHGYLAGEDDARVEELMQAFADPEVSAVFPARGGSGVTRILDQLDYKLICRHPKILTGFSDITALHSAVHSQTGLVTFHSPNAMDGVGRPDGMTELTAKTYWRALLAESYVGAGPSGYVVEIPETRRKEMATFAPGVARGRLVGGNLSLVCSVLGTPYEIEANGNILLLEDVGERPYRIDRFLSQLRMAGKLEVLDGVLLGQFTDCQPEEDGASLSLEQIFTDYFGELGIPVLQNFPTGHSPDNVTLPLGAEIELDSAARRVTILENPVCLKKK